VSADPELVRTAIDRDDAAGVRELLRHATEAERRACARALRPLLDGPDDGGPYPEGWLSLARRLAFQAAAFGLAPGAVAEAQEKKEAAAKPKKEHVAKAKTPKAPKPENDGVHSLLLTVADVVNTDSGGIMITASDGAAWKQTGAHIINGEGPQGGATFKVSKGFLGGYMCQISRWQSVRCQRDK